MPTLEAPHARWQTECMPLAPARRTAAAALLLVGLLALLAPAARAAGTPAPGEANTRAAGEANTRSAPSSAGLIDVVQIVGVIDRPVVAHLRDVVNKANADGAQLVAISLDTPGGVNVDLDDLVAIVAGSEVPVLTYVGPPGAQASGAGAVLAAASHLSAVSPVTRLGPATAVDLGAGEPDPQTLQRTATTLAELADRRGRDPEFARALVRDERVLTVLAPGATPDDIPADIAAQTPGLVALRAQDAVAQGAVDLVEPTLQAVLDAVSGREVAVEGADGEPRPVVIAVGQDDANVRFNNLGLLRRLLHTVANPTLAYLLVIAGALAIAFEVFQPGFGVAGFSGIGMAALGLYGLAQLPVNGFAGALLAAGLALLAVDLALAGLGAITAAGTLALALGSFLLFGGPPVLRVSPWVLGSVIAFVVLFFVVIMTTVLRAQGGTAMAGAEGLVGQTGVVRSMLNPEGHVFVGGSLWRARAPQDAGRVRTGTPVRVVGLDDALTLEVERVDSEPVVG